MLPYSTQSMLLFSYFMLPYSNLQSFPSIGNKTTNNSHFFLSVCFALCRVCRTCSQAIMTNERWTHSLTYVSLLPILGFVYNVLLNSSQPTIHTLSHPSSQLFSTIHWGAQYKNYVHVRRALL